MPAGSQPAVSPVKGNPSLNQFFGPGGLLSKTHPAYEFRRGQLQMAQAVEQALEERRHLIVEAGTGTGKTLAYLMPVIRSGKRVIISTGTKNLQEQLFHKDVPFLEQALFPEGNRKLSVCYMKGRNNYLCRKKLYDLTGQPVLNGLDEIEQYRAIAAWEGTGRSSLADRRAGRRIYREFRLGAGPRWPVGSRRLGRSAAVAGPRVLWVEARRR